MVENWLQARVIDTHTAGEPTRVLVSGGPDLGSGPLAERRHRFQVDFDHWRSALANEPRSSDVTVGAVLVPPHHPDCVTGVIFFNNVGYLGMCGHGTIGVGVALGHIGKIGKIGQIGQIGQIAAGRYLLDTPVGVVEIDYDGRNTVSFQNVASYRYQADVAVEVPVYGTIRGDIAWGGNWFFLVREPAFQLEASQIPELQSAAAAIRNALEDQGIAGEHGALIDHIELCGPSPTSGADARNFVLCPGGAYDRSPCGTGTSAAIACLAEDRKLSPGQLWRQESIIGSVFSASYEWIDGKCIPTVTGTAYVNAESTLLFDPDDPFAWGIRK